MRTPFFECPKCWKWSWPPSSFNELQHFAICPECGEAMYMIRTATPQSVGWREDQRVEARKDYIENVMQK